MDESALTGEAVSAGKSATTIGSDVDLAERANMVYQGTLVVDGQARAVVVATGSGTELGALGDSVESQRPTIRTRAGEMLAVAEQTTSTLPGQPPPTLTGGSVRIRVVPEKLAPSASCLGRDFPS